MLVPAKNTALPIFRSLTPSYCSPLEAISISADQLQTRRPQIRGDALWSLTSSTSPFPSSICPDLTEVTCPCPCNLSLSAEHTYIFFAETIPPAPDGALPTLALTPKVKNSLFQHQKQVLI